MQGVKNTFYDEIAFRIELAVTVILILAAMLLSVSLIVSVLLVFIIEPLNNVVEAAVDRIRTEQHMLSAKAKDPGSAAVFFIDIHKTRSCMGDSLV